MSEQRTGLLAGLGAYLLWGLFPLYWPLLEPAAPLEILGHRVVWSVLLLAGVLAFTAGFGWVRTLGRRRLGLLAAAAALISLNWFVFIFGVNSGHVVEVSLGYFMNPLVSIALGIVVLGERLRRAQKVAVGIAVVAVLVLAVENGRPPWIALTLAVSFALYGLAKKRVGLPGTQSLAVETTLIVVPAAAYLAFLAGTGDGTFTTEGPLHVALLVGSGVTTALPLVLFGAAAIRVPLATIGQLQYLAPVMQFVIGVVVYGEAMPAARWAGFTLVWIALVLFTVDAVRALRPVPRAAVVQA